MGMPRWVKHYLNRKGSKSGTTLTVDHLNSLNEYAKKFKLDKFDPVVMLDEGQKSLWEKMCDPKWDEKTIKEFQDKLNDPSAVISIPPGSVPRVTSSYGISCGLIVNSVHQYAKTLSKGPVKVMASVEHQSYGKAISVLIETIHHSGVGFKDRACFNDNYGVETAIIKWMDDTYKSRMKDFVKTPQQKYIDNLERSYSDDRFNVRIEYYPDEYNQDNVRLFVTDIQAESVEEKEFPVRRFLGIRNCYSPLGTVDLQALEEAVVGAKETLRKANDIKSNHYPEAVLYWTFDTFEDMMRQPLSKDDNGKVALCRSGINVHDRDSLYVVCDRGWEPVVSFYAKNKIEKHKEMAMESGAAFAGKVITGSHGDFKKVCGSRRFGKVGVQTSLNEAYAEKEYTLQSIKSKNPFGLEFVQEKKEPQPQTYLDTLRRKMHRWAFGSVSKALHHRTNLKVIFDDIRRDSPLRRAS